MRFRGPLLPLPLSFDPATGENEVHPLKDLGASKSLGTLIEGESLLNDGSAVVLFVWVRNAIGYDYNPQGWGAHHKRCTGWTDETPEGPSPGRHKICEADIGFQRVKLSQN